MLPSRLSVRLDLLLRIFMVRESQTSQINPFVFCTNALVGFSMSELPEPPPRRFRGYARGEQTTGSFPCQTTRFPSPRAGITVLYRVTGPCIIVSLLARDARLAPHSFLLRLELVRLLPIRELFRIPLLLQLLFPSIPNCFRSVEFILELAGSATHWASWTWSTPSAC